MSYAGYIWALLEPLGIYRKNGTFQMGELHAQGEALDGVEARLEELEREMCLATAGDWGLEQVAGLFRRRPVAPTTERLRAALAALLRIGGDSFTLAAINDTITGCGIPAVVKETGTGQVAVSFPGVAGEPEGFLELKTIIEDILPAHLGIEYDFWFLIWQELEDNFPSWRSIEDLELSWTQLETFVEYL